MDPNEEVRKSGNGTSISITPSSSLTDDLTGDSYRLEDPARRSEGLFARFSEFTIGERGAFPGVTEPPSAEGCLSAVGLDSIAALADLIVG